MLQNVHSTYQASGGSSHSYQHIESDKAQSSYNRICNECANQPSAIKQLILRIVKIHNASVPEEHKISSLHSEDLGDFSNQYPQISAMIKKLVDATDKLDSNFNKLAFILGEYSLLSKLLEKPVIVDKKTQTMFFQKFFIKHGTDSAVAKIKKLVNLECNIRKGKAKTVCKERTLNAFKQALDKVSLEPIKAECREPGYPDSHNLYYRVITNFAYGNISSFYNKLGFSYKEVQATLQSHMQDYENTNIELLSKFLSNDEKPNRNNDLIVQALRQAGMGGMVPEFKRHL